jgi:hypothetical protein
MLCDFHRLLQRLMHHPSLWRLVAGCSFVLLLVFGVSSAGISDSGTFGHAVFWLRAHTFHGDSTRQMFFATGLLCFAWFMSEIARMRSNWRRPRNLVFVLAWLLLWAHADVFGFADWKQWAVTSIFIVAIPVLASAAGAAHIGQQEHRLRRKTRFGQTTASTEHHN